MFRISRFQGLLRHLPRGRFQGLVERHGADKHCKGFTAWSHLTAMVYAQLANTGSLRQIVTGFNAHEAHHYHLASRQLSRSTLADANAVRSPQLFADVAHSLMSELHGSARRSCKELLYLLDSTSITLKGPGFDEWTLPQRSRHTQGVKLHVLYCDQAQAPNWYSITRGNASDVSQGRDVPLERGSVYVFDKGYYDFDWWQRIGQAGAVFVTRFKTNVALHKVKSLRCDGSAVLSDELVRFAISRPRGGKRNSYTGVLRRVTVAREGAAPLVLATNDLHSSATVIAQRYRARWQVELYFKWIKQHLGIKRYCGRSENAVRIQILTALIAYLLLKLDHAAQGAVESLWTHTARLRAALFQRPEVEQRCSRRRRQHALDFAAVQQPLPL
jgi:putative transposase